MESESLTVLSAILKNVSRDTAYVMDMRATPSWHWYLGRSWSPRTHTVV